jgi:Lysozyme like domain
MTLTLPLPHPSHLQAVSQYTAQEIHAALGAAGFDPTLWTVMDAIAGAESSWLPMVIQKGEPYDTTGWGTWQITPGNSEPSIGIDRQILPLLVNAKCAKVKYDAQGLEAWTTWRNGIYEKYVR